MSVRSCLLCGKPLSRIWVGSGEDFCSREHRNQYRLRRGMDRLLEANKVASVMRRRENLRTLSAGQLMQDGVLLPRAFPPMATGGARAHQALMPQPAIDCGVHLAATAGPLPPRPQRQAPETRPALPPAFPVPLFPPRAPRLEIRVPEALPPAPALPSTRARTASPERPQKLLISPWRMELSPVLRGRKPPVAARAECRKPIAKACSKPRQGHAFRVSMGTGFRLPEWRLRPVLLPAPALGDIAWPQALIPRVAPGRTPAAGVAGLVPVIQLQPPAMCLPPAPHGGWQRSFRWPGTIDLAGCFVNPPVIPRTAFVPFGNGEESSGKDRAYEYRN